MLSLLKLPIVIISYDFIVSDLAASPGASFRCPSEDSRAVSNDFEVVNEPACFVFLVGMIEQEVFDLLKVACFANVKNHCLCPFLYRVCFGLVSYGHYLIKLLT